MLGLASSGSYRIGDAQASVGISALLFGGSRGSGSPPLSVPTNIKRCLFHRRIGIMRSRGALNPAAQRNDFEGRKHGQAPLPSCMYGAVPATSRSVGVLKRPRSCGSCVTAKRPSSSKRPSRKAIPGVVEALEKPISKIEPVCAPQDFRLAFRFAIGHSNHPEIFGSGTIAGENDRPAVGCPPGNAIGASRE